jgi:hypothetical protein
MSKNEPAEYGMLMSGLCKCKLLDAGKNQTHLDKVRTSAAQEALCNSNNFRTASLLAGYKVLL